MIQVNYNRSVYHNRNLYTPKWGRINSKLGLPSEDGREFPQPKVIDKAISLAEKLSNVIPYLRVDLYIP